MQVEYLSVNSEPLDPLISILAGVLGTLLTAIFTAAVAWWKDWRQKRNSAHMRQQLLNRATSEVAFISTWMDAYERVAGLDTRSQASSRAIEDLENTYEIVASPQLEIPRKRTLLELAKSLWLMRDMRATGRTRLVRAFYRVALVWLAIWTSAAIAISIEMPTGTTIVGNVLAWLLVGVLPAYLARRWSIRSDKPAPGTSAQDRSIYESRITEG